MSDSHEPTFRKLLGEAQAGDEQAWQKLFARLASDQKEGADFAAMARKLLPPNDRARDFVDSMDLMQSALRSGWLDAAQFRGNSEAEFFGWLRTILRRKISRAVRRKRPQIGLEVEEESGEDRDVEVADPLGAMMRKELRDRLRSAIAELPQEQRDVLDLRLQGKKSPEISAELGVSPEAVRMRESRATKKLREVLKASGVRRSDSSDKKNE